jgi:hypothetical protein
VLPTNQGLATHDAPIGKVDRRLVMDPQLVEAQRRSQAVLQLEALERPKASGLVEHLMSGTGAD